MSDNAPGSTAGVWLAGGLKGWFVGPGAWTAGTAEVRRSKKQRPCSGQALLTHEPERYQRKADLALISASATSYILIAMIAQVKCKSNATARSVWTGADPPRLVRVPRPRLAAAKPLRERYRAAPQAQSPCVHIARNQVDFRFTRLPASACPAPCFPPCGIRLMLTSQPSAESAMRFTRQAHAVHRDRPFVGQVTPQITGRHDAQPQLSPTWAKCVTWPSPSTRPDTRCPPGGRVGTQRLFHIDGPWGCPAPWFSAATLLKYPP